MFADVASRSASVLGPMLVAGLFGLCAGMPLRAEQQNGIVAADMLRRQASERLMALQAEADQLAGEARGLLGQLRKLEIARQLANEVLRQADDAAAEARRELDDINGQVDRLEHARDTERPRLRSRFAELYKLGRGRYMRMLLSASDLRQVGQAARTVAVVAARDQTRVRQYEARIQELQAARAEVQTRQTTLEARRTDAARAQGAAAQALAAQNAMVRDIDRRRDLNAQLVGEMQAAQQKLEAMLNGVGSAGITALPMGPFRGALPWPTTGTPLRRSNAPGVHRSGVEIQGAEGTAVRAVHGGTVAYAGSFDGLGNLVIVDHGDQTFSLYGHLLDVSVGRGTSVRVGQGVGRLGSSATGAPTLYFELRVNGKAVDPLLWLERSR